MTGPVGPRPAGEAAGRLSPEREKLRQAAHDLEGLFVAELFKAMRATVPQDGMLSQTPGQDLFQGMLDDRIAELYAGKSRNGLGESLYRQLSRRLPESGRP